MTIVSPEPLSKTHHAQSGAREVAPFKTQLLKWVGNKQKFAHEIVSHFPTQFGTYHEPFLGSGAVLATLRPDRAKGSDAFRPLIDIWQTLSDDPEQVKRWYSQRYAHLQEVGRVTGYNDIRAAYNRAPNGADFLFLTRACYGGVVRFRKKDGYMSTPCGAHPPMKPASFAKRVNIWAERLSGAQFEVADYKTAMAAARPGDLIYCDPPYVHSQTILYGAQAFDLQDLFASIDTCRARGVFVALSIDGTKSSGFVQCELDVPQGLFRQEIEVNLGRSMLKRFQMSGQSLEKEVVTDRLLLTY